MNVVMTESGKIVEIQGTAEKETFTREDLNGLLDMSHHAVTTLIGLMKMDQIDSFKITENTTQQLSNRAQIICRMKRWVFRWKEGVICGLLPTFNKDWDQNKDVYALHDADIHRAYEFFNKHNLPITGFTHTHPKGIAYPSDADIGDQATVSFHNSV